MTEPSSTLRLRGFLADIIAAPATKTLALLALCSAYIQGPLTKIFDFPVAIAEMNHFGLQPAVVFAVVVILNSPQGK